MIDNIVKTFNENYGFWEVKCADDHRITTWKEGDDIKNYSSFTVAYCPKDTDFDVWRCVTKEEDKELMDKCIAAHKEEEAARRKAMGLEDDSFNV